MEAAKPAASYAGPLPPLFANCSDIYEDSDFKYSVCVIEDGSDPCYLLKETHRAHDFREYFLAIIPVVLSVIALLINFVCVFIQIRVSSKETSSYRKRCVFLISRSLSCIISLLLLYVVIIVWKASGFNYTTMVIFLIVGGSNFLSIVGTYLGVTILLYTAIVHPLRYKTRLRMRHCYILVGFIWISSTITSICIGIWGATLFYPDTAPVTCNFGSCQRPLAIYIVISLAVCFFGVLGTYGFVLLRLQKVHSKDLRKSTPSLVAMRRLGLNMAVFAIGSLPILAVCIVALVNLRHLASLGENEKSHCKTFLNSPLFVQVAILASIAALVWLLGMIVDPVINTIADHKMTIVFKNGVSHVSKSFKAFNRFSRSNLVHPADVISNSSE